MNNTNPKYDCIIMNPSKKLSQIIERKQLFVVRAIKKRFSMRVSDMEGEQGLTEQGTICYHGQLSANCECLQVFISNLCSLIHNAHI